MLIPCAIGDAGGDVGAACGSPRRRRSGSARRRLQLRAVRVDPAAQRLLAVLDAELGQLRQRVERLVERPVLVDVDLERDVGRPRARRAPGRRRGRRRRRASASAAGTARSRAPSRPSRAISSGAASPIVHEVGGPSRSSPSNRQTGSPSELPAEVVQRRVDRRARGELLVRQPPHHLVERERVVAEVAGDALDVRERRLGRLVVAVDRRRLPEARRRRSCRISTSTTSAVSCDPRAIVNVSASSRETIRALSSTRVHYDPRACSSGDRARASGARGRRFDSCQAHSPVCPWRPCRRAGLSIESR